MPDFLLEHSLTGLVIGIDEVGRGPLAGPVIVAAACFLSYDVSYENLIDDSKKLSKKRRESLYQILTSDSKFLFSIAQISNQEIDKSNILIATKMAAILACKELMQKIKVDHILIDGNQNFLEKEVEINVRMLVKGDAISNSIAAASVIAKVTRDRIMSDYHSTYPEYAWDKNSGYGTKAHLAAIEKYGVTKYHRLSFAPCHKNC